MNKLIAQSLAALIAGFLVLGCQSGHTEADTTANGSTTGTQADNPKPLRPQVGTKSTVPFKGNKDGVVELMSKVTGAEIRMDTTGEYGEGLAYRGGRFGGFPVVDWSFRFFNGQMLFSQINFNEKTAEVSSDSLYSAFSAMLTEWYGPPLLNSDVQITSLNDFTEGEQEFIGKVGSSLPGDFKLWSVGTNTQFVATLNKVKWNQAEEQYFVHLAFYDRSQAEAYFKQVQPEE